MSHIVADGVQESSTSSGTGNITLAGAVGNYRTFAGVGAVNNDTAWVGIEHATLNERQVCLATWTTGGVLVRGAVLWGTNGTSQVNFSAGGLTVSLVDPAGMAKWITDVPAATALVAPPSGLLIHARNFAGRRVPYIQDPNGDPYGLQSSLWRSKRFEWCAAGNSTTVSLLGFVNSVTGTATTRGVATTTFMTWIKRCGFVSAATAGSSAGTRHNFISFGRGNVAGAGGFLYSVRFGVSDAAAVADARMFVGMYGNNAVIGNVNPTTLPNIIGVGCDNGQTTLRIMHNDASGTATTIDLGANFPSNTLTVDFYELTLYCPPNGSSVGYRVERLNTGHVAEGTITTDLPASNLALATQVWRNNGATALAVGIDVSNQYLEMTV